MAYVTQEDLKGKIAPETIVAALDDDNDGAADTGVWDQIHTDVQQAIDSRLAPRYQVPFTGTLPPLVLEAAKVLACEAVYGRRGLSGEQKNPFAAAAKDLRERLQRIGEGDGSLGVSPPARPAGAVIGEATRTGSGSGLMV